MSKVLTFKNGQTVEFTDESTITNLITIVSDFSNVDTLLSYFTDENLVGATFDGELLTTIVPVTMTAHKAYEDDNVVLNFINRYKTDVEILQEQMTEVQSALAELAG